MKGAFSDPQGPRPWRMAAYLPPAVMLLTLLTGAWGATTGWALLGILCWTAAVGLFRRRQLKRRPVEITCGAGFVKISRAGSRSQIIHARDVEGASTARNRPKYVLTLSHRRRDEPVAIEVDTEAEVEQIRHALGIGHGGFGSIGWRTTTNSTDRVALVGRAVALLFVPLAAVAGYSGGEAIAGWLVLAATIGFILGLIGHLSVVPAPSVVMASGGLGLMTTEGWFTVPYAAVQSIEIRSEGLLFVVGDKPYALTVPTAAPWASTGTSRQDAEVMVAQIRAAAARARGYGKPKEDASGRVESLRRHGESPRDWLVRLDMAGQTLGGTSGGYRGFALDTEDLWRILEDPEADPELRAGAARVLRHSPGPEAHVRIDATVAAVRDDLTARKLRVAIRDDLDNACGELAEIDAREQMKRYALR